MHYKEHSETLSKINGRKKIFTFLNESLNLENNSFWVFFKEKERFLIVNNWEEVFAIFVWIYYVRSVLKKVHACSLQNETDRSMKQTSISVKQTTWLKKDHKHQVVAFICVYFLSICLWDFVSFISLKRLVRLCHCKKWNNELTSNFVLNWKNRPQKHIKGLNLHMVMMLWVDRKYLSVFWDF